MPSCLPLAAQIIAQDLPSAKPRPRPATDVAAAVADLADACAAREPGLTRMTTELHRLTDDLLRQRRPGEE